jgi:ribosome-associated protein
VKSTKPQRAKPQRAKPKSASTKSAKKAPAKKTAAKKAPPKPALQDRVLLERILKSLDDDKAEQIVTIDLGGRSALADAIVIASGRSARHVASIAEHLARRLKEAGYGTRPVNGASQGDWVLVDAGDIIVHIFRPEVRDYYDLEGMWSVGDGPREL